jgi:hypothetical protein
MRIQVVFARAGFGAGSIAQGTKCAATQVVWSTLRLCVERDSSVTFAFERDSSVTFALRSRDALADPQR